MGSKALLCDDLEEGEGTEIYGSGCMFPRKCPVSMTCLNHTGRDGVMPLVDFYVMLIIFGFVGLFFLS